MTRPLFSVVIPTFNSEKTLKCAIESILNQTYDHFEILLIDGLSNDNTLQLAQSFKDDRIRIFCEPDSGIYDAMNKGIHLSHGEWLYFIGSDDRLQNCEVLKRIADIITINRPWVVYGNVEIVNDSGWARDKEIYAGFFNLEKIIHKNICHQAMFYNRAVFRQVGTFNLKYIVCADYDFNLRCFAKFPFYYCGLTIAFFYGGGQSILKEDTFFNQDRISNILLAFENQLYKKAFLPFANFIKGEIFSSSISLNFFRRTKLLAFFLILKLKGG